VEYVREFESRRHVLRHLAADLGKARLFEKVDGVLVVAAAGIVLIDEIDAHLHATWQQRIGHGFKKHFPRCQFLVATHSAIVCQAADRVLLLPDPGTGAAPRTLSETELARVRYGDPLDAFDAGAFGDGITRSEESRHKLQRLAELNPTELQRPLTDAERAELRELRHVTPSSAFTTDRDALMIRLRDPWHPSSHSEAPRRAPAGGRHLGQLRAPGG